MSEVIIEEVVELSEEELAEEEFAMQIRIEGIIEAGRLKDLQDRYSNLKDHRAVGAALGISNVDLHVNRDILGNSNTTEAEVLMVLLETTDLVCHEESLVISYSDARLSEYKSIEEIIHVILDHGIGSQEFIDLQLERTAIKAKYPKI